VETLLKLDISLRVIHQQGSGTLLRRNTENVCSDLTPYMCKRNYFSCPLVELCLAPMAAHWETQQICDRLEVSRVYLGDTSLLGEKDDQRFLATLD